jgi:hypothetical protein
MAGGLAGAGRSDLPAVEIVADGLSLSWPKLDATLYVPALLQGSFLTAERIGDGDDARDDYAEKLLALCGTIDPSVDLEF